MKNIPCTKVTRNYRLTFLLTFLVGRLTFFLTFSYKVRIVFISSTVFWYAGSCCWLKPARCMATGSLWVFNIVFWYVGAAAGPSWLLKPFSAYVRLTFCLRFSYVKNCPYETLRNPLLGQWQCEKHKETHQDPHNWFWVMSVLFFFILKLHSIKGNENKPKKVTTIKKNNIKSLWKHVCPTYAIPGLRFCLRFWRGVLRFSLRFPIKCE